VAEPTVLVDTNVLIAAMLGSTTARQTLRAIVTRAYDWVTTPALIVELNDVPRRSKFEGVITAAHTRAMLRQLRDHARLIHPSTIINACRDPRDNHVLAAAVDSHATHLITGDRDLLVLTPFRGTGILPPTEFLAELSP